MRSVCALAVILSALCAVAFAGRLLKDPTAVSKEGGHPRWAPYYIFALQQCEGTYTIHGLWPQWNSQTWPQFCNSSAPFDYSQIESLLPQLQQNWPSCESRQQVKNSDKSFYSHEWNKHGTCTPFSEYTYFAMALQMYQTVPWTNQCQQQAKNRKPGDSSECLVHVNVTVPE